MGHRLSKIYTRTGDAGTTGLADGRRVDKTDPRVEAMGAVDELNCAIGLLLTEALPASIEAALTEIQHTLFDVGGELSMPGHTLVHDASVNALEALLDELNAPLAPLKEFILPGGSRAAAYCHLARAVCRRAERRLLPVTRSAEGNPASGRYLNRLSDLLFVMARSLNVAAGREDVQWHQRRRQAGA